MSKLKSTPAGSRRRRSEILASSKGHSPCLRPHSERLNKREESDALGGKSSSHSRHVLSEGFAMYEESTDTFSGLDAEFCGAIAASMFKGDPDRVEFVVLNSTNCFPALSEGNIDILMGQELTLTNEFFEPTTGDSFAFTEPYFWSENFESRAMVTRHDDSTWSSFVYWVETAIVYAEENDIDSTSAIEMPAVSYFGESLLQCFRDCVAAVGNYGEIYNRTMETMVPRGGANLLNSSPYGPQQVGYPLA